MVWSVDCQVSFRCHSTEPRRSRPEKRKTNWRKYGISRQSIYCVASRRQSPLIGRQCSKLQRAAVEHVRSYEIRSTAVPQSTHSTEYFHNIARHWLRTRQLKRCLQANTASLAVYDWRKWAWTRCLADAYICFLLLFYSGVRCFYNL